MPLTPKQVREEQEKLVNIFCDRIDEILSLSYRTRETLTIAKDVLEPEVGLRLTPLFAGTIKEIYESVGWSVKLENNSLVFSEAT
jgi:hypothetical protein